MFFSIDTPSRSPQFEIKEEDADYLKRIHLREREIYQKKENSESINHSPYAYFISFILGANISFIIVNHMNGIDSNMVKGVFTLVVGGLIALIPYIIYCSIKSDIAFRFFYHDYEMVNLSNNDFDIISKYYQLFYSTPIPLSLYYKTSDGYFLRYRVLVGIIKKIEYDTIIKPS